MAPWPSPPSPSGVEFVTIFRKAAVFGLGMGNVLKLPFMREPKPGVKPLPVPGVKPVRKVFESKPPS